MLMLVSGSVKVAPVSAMLLVFVSVKETTLVPPCAMGLVANALAMVGAAVTITCAVLEPGPVAASLLEMPLAVLGYPAAGLTAVAVTARVTVQPPAPTGTVRLPKERVPVWPAVKLFAEAPGQVPPAALAAAACKLPSTSVKLA